MMNQIPKYVFPGRMLESSFKNKTSMSSLGNVGAKELINRKQPIKYDICVILVSRCIIITLVLTKMS